MITRLKLIGVIAVLGVLLWLSLGRNKTLALKLGTAVKALGKEKEMRDAAASVRTDKPSLVKRLLAGKF